MAERSKAELARRLGIAERDLISRADAAAILGVEPDTLRTHADVFVGFYRLSESQTARALYPKPWVEEYKRWRAAGRKTRFPDDKMGRDLSWPVEPTLKEITAHQAIVMMDRWKYRELHFRCEAIFGGERSFEDLLPGHRAEWQKLFEQDGKQRPVSEAEVADVLADKIKELVLPAGTIVALNRLLPLMQMVWVQVLETERGWLSKMKR